MADAGTPPAKKAKRAGPAAPPNGADRSASDLDSVQLQLSQLRDAMIGLQTQVQYGVAQQARVQAEALRLLRGLAAHVGIETEDGVDEAPARAEPTVATPAANGAGHRPLLADAGQRMSPEVSTVRDLWSEWTVGRGGYPPVKVRKPTPLLCPPRPPPPPPRFSANSQQGKSVPIRPSVLALFIYDPYMRTYTCHS